MIALFEFVIAASGIFLVCWVVWLIVSVSGRSSRNNRNLDDTETEQLEELNRMAEAMAERIKTLETLLDADSPEWRDYDDKT